MAACRFSTNVGLHELDIFCHVYQKIGVEVDGAHLYCTYHFVSMSSLLFIPTLFILTDKISTVGKFWRVQMILPIPDWSITNS